MWVRSSLALVVFACASCSAGTKTAGTNGTALRRCPPQHSSRDALALKYERGAFCVNDTSGMRQLSTSNGRLKIPILPLQPLGDRGTARVARSRISLGEHLDDAVFLWPEDAWYQVSPRFVLNLSDGREGERRKCQESGKLILESMRLLSAELNLEPPKWCNLAVLGSRQEPTRTTCQVISEFYVDEAKSLEYPHEAGTYVSLVVAGGTIGAHIHTYDEFMRADCQPIRFESSDGGVVGSVASVSVRAGGAYPKVEVWGNDCIGVVVGKTTRDIRGIDFGALLDRSLSKEMPR